MEQKTPHDWIMLGAWLEKDKKKKKNLMEKQKKNDQSDRKNQKRKENWNERKKTSEEQSLSSVFSVQCTQSHNHLLSQRFLYLDICGRFDFSFSF